MSCSFSIYLNFSPQQGNLFIGFDEDKLFKVCVKLRMSPASPVIL